MKSNEKETFDIRKISLPDDDKKLDEVLKTLREDHAMEGQTLGALISANALILGITGLPVALALASLAFPIPAKAIVDISEFGKINRSDWNVVVITLVLYPIGFLTYLVLFTLLPALTLLNNHQRVVSGTTKYLFSDISEKRTILREWLERSSRGNLFQRVYGRRATKYALAVSCLIFLLATGISVAVLLAHIPSP